MRTILCLLIISLLCNGCATIGKNKGEYSKSETEDVIDDQSTDDVVNEEEKKKSIMDNEVVQGVVFLIALPICIPVLFFAALFGGIG